MIHKLEEDNKAKDMKIIEMETSLQQYKELVIERENRKS